MKLPEKKFKVRLTPFFRYEGSTQWHYSIEYAYYRFIPFYSYLMVGNKCYVQEFEKAKELAESLKNIDDVKHFEHKMIVQGGGYGFTVSIK